MQIDTRGGRFAISNPGGNVARNGIVEPVPFSTITAPTPQQNAPSTGVVTTNQLTDGVIEMAGDGATGPGGLTANSLQMIPYGTGSATNTFTMKAYGWRRTGGVGANLTGLWVPYLLASFTVTLGTATGVGGCDVNASQLLATTIALVTGNANVSNEILSPTGNVIAHIILDAKGAAYVELRFSTGGVATDCNCMVAKV